MTSEIEHEYTREIVCPYCGYEFSDSYECGPDSEMEWHTSVECGMCDKSFMAQRIVTVDYSTEKADCLNGDEKHNLEKVNHFLGYPDFVRCNNCDYESRGKFNQVHFNRAGA